MQLIFKNTDKLISDFPCTFNNSFFLKEINESQVMLPFTSDELFLLEKLLSTENEKFNEYELIKIITIGSYLQIEGEKWNKFKNDFIQALDWRTIHFNPMLENILEKLCKK